MINYYKKNFLYILIFILLPNNVFAVGSIATIDLNMILNESNSGKKVLSNIQKFKSKNISQIDNKQKKLKVLEVEIENQKNLLSKEDLNLKLINFKKEINEFRLFQNKLANEFNIKKNTEIKNFFEKINPTIQKYMEESDIGILIDKKNIYIANNSNDITSTILKIMD